MNTAQKTILSVIIFSLIFLGLAVPDDSEAANSGVCGENLTWMFDQTTGSLTIVGSGSMYNNPSFDGNEGFITVVHIGNGATSIGDNAFSGCTRLTTVTISNTLTSIGDNAFSGCTHLTTVTISNTLTSIGAYAFYGCTSLASITIPSPVTSIGDHAFFGCTSLASFEVAGENTSYSSDSGVLFNKDKTTLIQYPAGKTDATYEIPASVKSIVNQAFYGCTSLASFEVEGGNTSYSSADGVLLNSEGTTLVCYPAGKSGTSYVIHNSVTEIDDFAFYGCTRLTTVTISDSLISIGGWAFYGCTSLASIINPGSVSLIGDYAFYYCTSLASIPLFDSLTEIGTYAFYGCTSLASIDISASVTSIGDNAFYGCTSLASFEVAGDNTSYLSESNVLFNKDITTLVCYPAGKSGTSYVIPNSVKSIGMSAFSCTSLASITIPASVTSIATIAFSDCTSLASITIPASVTSIGVSAFSYCTSLTSIDIGDCSGISSNSFPHHTFYEEDGVTQIAVGSDGFIGHKFRGDSIDKMIRIDSPGEKHKVTYDIDGGSLPAPTQIEVEEGKSFTVAHYSGTKTGYTFGGWSCGGTTYAPGSTVTMGTSDMLLKAIWKPTQYITVTFDSNGGTPTGMQETTGADGKLTEFPEAPVKDGYSFAGWYTSKSGGTPITLNTIFSQDTTVYAHWTAGPVPVVKVTVTFKSSPGGSVTASSIQVPLNAKIYVDDDIIWFGSQAAYSAMAVADKGYSFVSWSVTEGTVTSDMTIDVTFKAISGIAVSKAPVHLDYKAGEKFDPAGLVISLTLDGGTTKTVEYKWNKSEFTFSPSLSTPLKAGDKSVTVSYGGKSLTLDINVSGSSSSGDVVWWVVIAVAALVVLAAGAYWIARHRT